MECDRFKRLLKSWYVQVQDEALAPARMVELMENHISECPTCLMDPEARKDMEKVITLVLPKDKLVPPSRSNRAAETAADDSGHDDSVDDEENIDNDENDDDDDDDDIDDEDDDDDDDDDF